MLAFSPQTYWDLIAHGIRVPEDVAFATLHCHRSDVIDARIAGLDQCTEQVGRAAVNLLDQMIRHGERGVPSSPMSVRFDPKWRPGASLPEKK